MSSAYPRMAASGVRNSWLMLATNWFLCWLAISRSSTVLASSRVRACTSSKRRVFSIAITAWSAKVLTSSIWRSANGRTSARRMTIAPIACVDQGDAERGAITELERMLPALGIFIRFGEHVCDLNCSAVDDGTPRNEPTSKWVKVSDRGGRSNLPMVRDEAQTIAKYLKDCRVIRIAQSRCGLHQRIEYFLHVERRPADDLQNVGGGSLLFQGFRQLALARLLSLEQSRVLNGDHRLVGEGLDQRDLLVIERRDPGPRQCDDADGLALQQQGHG